MTGPPPGQGGYYPQQPQQAYGQPPYGQPYQPQPPPQTVYVYVTLLRKRECGGVTKGAPADNNKTRVADRIPAAPAWRECACVAVLKVRFIKVPRPCVGN